MKDTNPTTLEHESWTRRRLLRASAVTAGGLTMVGPRLLVPTPAPAWVWVALRPFLKELGIAIGASVIGSLISEHLIEPRFRRRARIPESEVAKGRTMLERNGFSEFEETPEVRGTAAVSGGGRGAGAYDRVEDVIFGAVREDNPNGCASFVTHTPKRGLSMVMVEGPTVSGMLQLAKAFRSRVSDEPRELRDALVPIAEVEKDLGRFEKSYRAEHETRDGTIETRYEVRPGSGNGIVQTTLKTAKLRKPFSVSQDVTFDREAYDA